MHNGHFLSYFLQAMRLVNNIGYDNDRGYPKDNRGNNGQKQIFMTFIVCFVTVHNGFTMHNAQFPLLHSELWFAMVWTYMGSRGKPWPKP